MNRDIIGIYHGNVAMDTGISAAIFARDLKGQPFRIQEIGDDHNQWTGKPTNSPSAS